MMNRAKNSRAKIKDIIAISPDILSPVLKESIVRNSGTNKKSINPIAEPAPCIFEAIVTMSRS